MELAEGAHDQVEEWCSATLCGPQMTLERSQDRKAASILTVDMRSNVQSCPTDARGASACLHPVPLHAGHQPQCSAGDLCALLLHTQAVCESMQIQAGVHRPGMQAKSESTSGILNTRFCMLSGSLAYGNPADHTLPDPGQCRIKHSPVEHGLLLQA